MTRKINRKAAESKKKAGQSVESDASEIQLRSLPKLVNIVSSAAIFFVAVILYLALYVVLMQVSITATMAMSDVGLLQGGFDTIAVISATLGGAAAGLVVTFAKFFRFVKNILVLKPFNYFQAFVSKRESKKSKAGE